METKTKKIAAAIGAGIGLLAVSRFILRGRAAKSKLPISEGALQLSNASPFDPAVVNARKCNGLGKAKGRPEPAAHGHVSLAAICERYKPEPHGLKSDPEQSFIAVRDAFSI